MSTVNEASLQVAIDELRSKANLFSASAGDIHARATFLATSALDITYSASDWIGSASTAFQNAWGQYDLDSHKAIEALEATATAFTNLAQRLESALQAKRDAEQRANALLVATIGLTLLDIMQLGMDPATDALTAGTAAGAAAVAAETFDLGSLVAEADIAMETEISGVTTTTVGTLTTLSDPGLTYLTDGYLAIAAAGNETTGSVDQSTQPEQTITGDSSGLFVGTSASLWQNPETDVQLGQLGNNPVSATTNIEVLPANIGFGIQTGKDGTPEVGLQSSISLLSSSDGIRVGTKDLGATGEIGSEVLGVEGNAGLIDNSVQADVGVTVISDSGSVGVNLDKVNVSVDGTIGLKAEFGFDIGEHTEIKLPFVSFGFSIGAAK